MLDLTPHTTCGIFYAFSLGDQDDLFYCFWLKLYLEDENVIIRKLYSHDESNSCFCESKNMAFHGLWMGFFGLCIVFVPMGVSLVQYLLDSISMRFSTG